MQGRLLLSHGAVHLGAAVLADILLHLPALALTDKLHGVVIVVVGGAFNGFSFCLVHIVLLLNLCFLFSANYRLIALQSYNTDKLFPRKNKKVFRPFRGRKTLSKSAANALLQRVCLKVGNGSEKSRQIIHFTTHFLARF